MNKKRDIIIPCDFPNMETLETFLGKMGDQKLFCKIGMELYYAEGERVVWAVKEAGHRVFLDLKLHDIPNTVRNAMAVLSKFEVDMINLHAGGGRAMMEAALEGITTGGRRKPITIAVTILTSLGDDVLRDELLIKSGASETALHYAKNAKAAGLCGIVCSPLEAGLIHAACGDDFVTVTPGVRFADGEVGDQVRVTTPAKARELGSDFIVVGRPITGASDPLEAYKRCAAEFGV
jgi:orotidine-5'-phosphate decarboxylase